MRMNWKQQSILLSSLRGPDVPNVPNIKIVNRWMRMQCQHNADTTKNYMEQKPLPVPIHLCDELEFLPCHFVHHFSAGLAVIAYNHPDFKIAVTSAKYHYRIAEELFHFQPEPPGWFMIRHADRPDPRTPHPFHAIVRDAFDQYMSEVRSRFR